MPNIGFDRVHHLVDSTGEDEFSHVQTEGHNHLRLNVPGQRVRQSKSILLARTKVEIPTLSH
jgi:hypothetical protein